MDIDGEAGFVLRIAGASKSEAESIYKLRFNESDLHFFQIPSRHLSRITMNG